LGAPEAGAGAAVAGAVAVGFLLDGGGGRGTVVEVEVRGCTVAGSCASAPEPVVVLGGSVGTVVAPNAPLRGPPRLTAVIPPPARAESTAHHARLRALLRDRML
jgi:hypothetical protein